MARLMLIPLILASLFPAAFSEGRYLYDDDPAKPVVEYMGASRGNFKESKAPKIVEFYDPLCGACQGFKPDYIKLAKEVTSKAPNVEFYAVSCSAYHAICKENAVKAYPTLLAFKQGGQKSEVLKKSALLRSRYTATDVIKALGVRVGVGASEDVPGRKLPESKVVQGHDQVDEKKEEDGRDEEEDEEQEEDDKKEESETIDVKNTIDEGKGTDVKKSHDKSGSPNRSPGSEAEGTSERNKRLAEWKAKRMELRQNKEKGEIGGNNRAASQVPLRPFRDGRPEMVGRPEDSSMGQNEKRGRESPRMPPPRGDETPRDIPPPGLPDAVVNTANAHGLPLTGMNGFTKGGRMGIPVGGGPSAPNPMFPSEETAKKFQEYVQKKKADAERREKFKRPIKSVMGGVDPKTENHRAKPGAIEGAAGAGAQYRGQEGIRRPPSQTVWNSRQTADADVRKGGKMSGPRQGNVAQKVLGNVPIIKHAFKKSKEVELLSDAALSFVRGLRMGVFDTDKPLDSKRKQVLVDWLDLLSISLPPEIGLHSLIDDLRNNMDYISQSQEKMESIIAKHPLPDEAYSESCSKGRRGQGFYCGSWKLLHLMTVGVAEQRGGQALVQDGENIRIFSTEEAADVLREYMAYFFTCVKCRNQFVAQYDQCSFRRCDRLSDETYNASPEVWKELPLWLWEVHNDVSRSKTNEMAKNLKRVGRKEDAMRFERDIRAIYPHLEQCLACFNSDGTWNEDAVYVHLEKEYWSFGARDAKMDRLLDYNEETATSSGLTFYTGVAAIVFAVWTVRKRSLKLTGWHKKVDSSLNRAVPLQNGGGKLRSDGGGKLRSV